MTHLGNVTAPSPEAIPSAPHARTAKILRIFVSPETKAMLRDFAAEAGCGAGGAAGLILEELAQHGLLEQVWQAHRARHRARLEPTGGAS